MKTYEFTLRFSLSAPDVPVDVRLERLADAGCDDALSGIGHGGMIALAFSRVARSAREAVLSAVADAMRAMPDAQLVEATPDLVGLTDIASIMGFSRQNMRKLMQAGGPAPVHDGNPSLWHLAQLLGWLRDRGYPAADDAIELAAITMQLNLAADSANVDAATRREINATLGSY
jgi:hypothetical protein